MGEIPKRKHCTSEPAVMTFRRHESVELCTGATTTTLVELASDQGEFTFVKSRIHKLILTMPELTPAGVWEAENDEARLPATTTGVSLQAVGVELVVTERRKLDARVEITLLERNADIEHTIDCPTGMLVGAATVDELSGTASSVMVADANEPPVNGFVTAITNVSLTVPVVTKVAKADDKV